MLCVLGTTCRFRNYKALFRYLYVGFCVVFAHRGIKIYLIVRLYRRNTPKHHQCIYTVNYQYTDGFLEENYIVTNQSFCSSHQRCFSFDLLSNYRWFCITLTLCKFCPIINTCVTFDIYVWCWVCVWVLSMLSLGKILMRMYMNIRSVVCFLQIKITSLFIMCLLLKLIGP